ncbi:MAG: hypothetical protein AB1793_07575 [Candidatus Thermoplasmatota archaeon]
MPGGTLKFDFDTWLAQNYGLKADRLTKRELAIATKEYEEEYPPPGEGEIKLKTYPFKRYLDSKG